MSKHPKDPAERTSVSLPRSIARRLASEAAVTGRPASSIVRDALTEYFADQEPPPLPSFTGVGDSGRSDTSRRAEEIVSRVIKRKHRR